MRVKADRFLAFGEYLAHRVDLGDAAVQPIAAELGVPYTTLIEWWRHLEYHRALLVSPDGVEVDRPRLLQVMTAHRVARMTPRVTRPIALDTEGVAEVLDLKEVPYALAVLSAANAWTFFEPRRNVQVFVASSDLTRVRQALPTVPEGRFTLEVFGDNPDHLPTVVRGGFRLTSAFLTLLDCRAHPEGGAHANFLERNVIQWGRPRSGAGR